LVALDRGESVAPEKARQRLREKSALRRRSIA